MFNGKCHYSLIQELYVALQQEEVLRASEIPDKK